MHEMIEKKPRTHEWRGCVAGVGIAAELESLMNLELTPERRGGSVVAAFSPMLK